MPRAAFAISIRQPWASLIVNGVKSVEVRRWQTARRGRVLIHASRLADERPEVWARVPTRCRECAGRRGGIVGVADLTDCVTYRSPAEFARDRRRHLNDPRWFEGPVLYGFVLANGRPLPFRACPGWVRFFQVADTTPDGGGGE